MADLHAQHGVSTGCAVTAQASPNMTVAVAAGSVLNSNVAAPVAAQNATITTANATQDRWDTISVDNTGAVTVTAGTPADTPVQPDTTDVVIAHVFVYSQANASYTGTIVNGVIQDVRQFVLVHTSPYKASSFSYGPPGVLGTSTTLQLNTMTLAPFFTAKTMSINAIQFELLATFTATAVARLGIYADDGTGTLSLLVDAGTVAVDTLGNRGKSITISQTLTPGWWWFAWALQVAGPGSGTVTIVNPLGISPVGIPLSLSSGGAFKSVGAMVVPSVSGALPSSPARLELGGGLADGSTYEIPMVWVKCA